MGAADRSDRLQIVAFHALFDFFCLPRPYLRVLLGQVVAKAIEAGKKLAAMPTTLGFSTSLEESACAGAVE